MGSWGRLQRGKVESQGTKPTFLVWTKMLESAKKTRIPTIITLYNKEWQMAPIILKNHTLFLINYVPFSGIFIVFWHILTRMLSDLA